MRWLLVATGLLLAAALLFWALREISWAQLARALSALQAWQIAVILLVNAAMMLLFSLRWWLVLRAQGYPLPLLAAARYRLAAFAVSFLTPGQHIGGEPLQVLFLRRHSVPTDAAAASVAFDRLVEYFVNTAVLVAGVFVLRAAGLFAGLPLGSILPVLLALLILVGVYILTLAHGWRPFGRLLHSARGRLAAGLVSTERQFSELAARPRLLLLCLLPSVLTWAALFFESWLMLRFLGLHMDALGLLAVSMAGRVAQFSPTPGALGAIEASQVLAMQTLGIDPAYGIALSLLIHARDIFFTLLGMMLGAGDIRSYRRTHV